MHLRAPPPPLRGQRPLPEAARGGGTDLLGHEPRRGAAGDRREAGPSLVRGRAVPSGAEEQAVRSTSLVQELHRGRSEAVAAGLSDPPHRNSAPGLPRETCEMAATPRLS